MMHRFRLASLSLSICVVALIWYVVYLETNNRELTVAFLDVGQGDAIFIESPTGNQMLIDGGPGKSVLGELGAVMSWYDRSLDVVMATHPDADHIGGLPEVLERFTVDTFLESGATTDTQLFAYLESVRATHPSNTITAKRGLQIDLGGGAVMTVLYPYDNITGLKTNDTSIVARLDYRDQSFLLTGDASSKVERQILARDGKLLSADVLKVGHHGSKTSTDPSFLAAVDPKYAVISAGANNRYGHPHKDVVERLENSKGVIFTTAKQGTIAFTIR